MPRKKPLVAQGSSTGGSNPPPPSTTASAQLPSSAKPNRKERRKDLPSKSGTTSTTDGPARRFDASDSNTKAPAPGSKPKAQAQTRTQAKPAPAPSAAGISAGASPKPNPKKGGGKAGAKGKAKIDGSGADAGAIKAIANSVGQAKAKKVKETKRQKTKRLARERRAERKAQRAVEGQDQGVDADVDLDSEAEADEMLGEAGPGPSTAASRAKNSNRPPIPSDGGVGVLDMNPNAVFDLDDEEAEMNQYTPTAFKPLTRRSILGGVRLDGILLNTGTGTAAGLSTNAHDTNGPETPRRGGLRMKADDIPGLASAATKGTKIPVKKRLDTAAGEGTDGSRGRGEDGKQEDDALVLPAHVLLEGVGTDTNHENGEEEDNEGDGFDMEGLHFFDSSIVKGATRYFDPNADDDEDPDSDAAFLANADLSKQCLNCKKPGHSASACPHVVCAFCGAVDQHTRRECPISTTCFNCGKTGHESRDCTEARNRDGCDLCGARNHPKQKCPSLWRIYEYLNPSERRARQEERRQATGWAAEALGCLPDVDWCYNCADTGHLGDDCTLRRGAVSFRTTSSAFSFAIAAAGPYRREFRSYTAQAAPRGNHQRFDESSGSDLPGQEKFEGANPGQRGKAKAKIQQQQRVRAALGDSYDGDNDGDDIDDLMVGTDMSHRGGGGLSMRGRGRGRGGMSTPRGGGTASRRGWDSEIRGGTSGSGTGARGNMPFSHAHLMSPLPSAPSSVPSRSSRQGISFGRISGEALGQGGRGGGLDTPTGPRGSQGGGTVPNGIPTPSSQRGAGAGRGPGGSRALVERALGIAHSTPSSRNGSPAPRDPRPSGASHGGRGSRLVESESEMEVSPRKRRRNGAGGVASAEEQGERDWEANWRATGAGGGKVVEWGKEDDEIDRRERKAARERVSQAQGQIQGQGKGKDVWKGDGGSRYGGGIKGAAQAYVAVHGVADPKGKGKREKVYGNNHTGAMGKGREDDRAKQGPSRGQGKGQMYTGGY